MTVFSLVIPVKIINLFRISCKLKEAEMKEFINIYLPMNLFNVFNLFKEWRCKIWWHLMHCLRYRPTLRLTWWPGMGTTRRTSTTWVTLWRSTRSLWTTWWVPTQIPTHKSRHKSRHTNSNTQIQTLKSQHTNPDTQIFADISPFILYLIYTY